MEETERDRAVSGGGGEGEGEGGRTWLAQDKTRKNPLDMLGYVHSAGRRPKTFVIDLLEVTSQSDEKVGGRC